MESFLTLISAKAFIIKQMAERAVIIFTDEKNVGC
jgi:hypothetical protein